MEKYFLALFFATALLSSEEIERAKNKFLINEPLQAMEYHLQTDRFDTWEVRMFLLGLSYQLKISRGANL